MPQKNTLCEAKHTEMRMNMKNTIFVIGSLVLSVLLFCVIWWMGKQINAVPSQEKRTVAVTGTENRKPQIYAVNRRLKQGEKIHLSRLAHARDADGSDLSSGLRCYDETGRQLSGYFDTRKPGKWVLSWEVTSICTGRRVKKKMIVLVDGRVKM